MTNKITKKDKYAMEFLHNKGLSNLDIAKELELDIKQVKRFLSQVTKTETEDKKPESKEEEKVDKTKNLMIRQTSSKKNNSVSIMTQGASQIGDEFYKNINSSPKNTDNYIYRRK
jgi:predicted transcriptional regulator